jgi:precorrin-6B methylase 2
MNIAINSSEESKIFTLDLPKDQLSATQYSLLDGEDVFVNRKVSGERFISKSAEEFPEKKKITQLYGDSASYNYEPYLDSIDFVFIDGSHTYEYVLNDTNIALKLLKKGKGIIVWHDYGAFASVTKALNKIQKNNPQFELLQIEKTSLVYLKLD